MQSCKNVWIRLCRSSSYHCAAEYFSSPQRRRVRRGSFPGISQVVTLFANIYLSHFLTFGFALMASYFSVNSDRKVTKRTPPRNVCPSGSRGIRLCQRAVLTRRPGSTGLNSTSLSNFPYQSRMPRQTSRGIQHFYQTVRRVQYRCVLNQ